MSGRFDEARQRPDEARKLFIKLKNEPNRVATVYNMGHLARERRPARWSSTRGRIQRGRLGRGHEIGALVELDWRPDLNRRGLRVHGGPQRGDDGRRALDGWVPELQLVEAPSVRVAPELGRRDEAEQRPHALAHTERDVDAGGWAPNGPSLTGGWR